MATKTWPFWQHFVMTELIKYVVSGKQPKNKRFLLPEVADTRNLFIFWEANQNIIKKTQKSISNDVRIWIWKFNNLFVGCWNIHDNLSVLCHISQTNAVNTEISRDAVCPLISHERSLWVPLMRKIMLVMWLELNTP